ncbi:MAG: hypothetical protein INR65_16800, partial [Gluconacetobacter diazotrophicus]|nr:hypothetical protein [Gluconacetobacter diazotrophicus]
MVDAAAARRSRFWSAVLLSSVFGTNMGDLVAGPLHLGHVQGLPPLLIVFALLLACGFRSGGPRAGTPFGVPPAQRPMSEPFFWAAIATLRTGATNVADFANHQHHLSAAVLLPLLAALLALLARFDRTVNAERGVDLRRLGVSYWSAMFVAGVFGTVAGDAAEDALGDWGACSALSVLLLPFFLSRCAGGFAGTMRYWLVVALARTLGTALGDTLADRDGIGLGVPLSTACTAAAF